MGGGCLLCAEVGAMDDTPLYEEGLALGADHTRGLSKLDGMGYRCVVTQLRGPAPRTDCCSVPAAATPHSHHAADCRSWSFLRPACLTCTRCCWSSSPLCTCGTCPHLACGSTTCCCGQVRCCSCRMATGCASRRYGAVACTRGACQLVVSLSMHANLPVLMSPAQHSTAQHAAEACCWCCPDTYHQFHVSYLLACPQPAPSPFSHGRRAPKTRMKRTMRTQDWSSSSVLPERGR